MNGKFGEKMDEWWLKDVKMMDKQEMNDECTQYMHIPC
jgi:hypothetical protein